MMSALEHSSLPDALLSVVSALAELPTTGLPVVLEHLRSHWKLYAVVIAAGAIVGIESSLYGLTVAGVVAATKPAIAYWGGICIKLSKAATCIVKVVKPVTAAAGACARLLWGLRVSSSIHRTDVKIVVQSIPSSTPQLWPFKFFAAIHKISPTTRCDSFASHGVCY